MKAFNGYTETRKYEKTERLPKGGYVLRVVDAEEVTYSWGSVLKISFDVAEGDFKEFYKKNYDAQTQEDKKWKGTFNLALPKDDGSEKDGWTKSRFKTIIEDGFEASNPGYRWDWDETKLKGKLIGGLFIDKEWEYNGKSGWFTSCKTLIAAQDIRDGNFTQPSDEPLKTKMPEPPKVGSDGFMNIPDGIDEELPFD